MSDVLDLLKNKSYIFIVLLCASFYAVVFPFQDYLADLLKHKFGFAEVKAGDDVAAAKRGLVRLYLRGDRPDEAAALAEQVSRSADKDDHEAKALLAMAYYRQGRLNRADDLAAEVAKSANKNQSLAAEIAVERSKYHYAQKSYREAAAAASVGPDSARAFARTYPFDVRPTGDDRPFFGRFLRLGFIPNLLRGNPGEWVPHAEWGYLATLATFVQSGILALLLMGLPALILGRLTGREERSFGGSTVYFGGIGVGFILVEMMAIQQLSLVLGHPVYAASATLGLLLFSSGFGSWVSDRVPAHRARWA